MNWLDPVLLPGHQKTEVGDEMPFFVSVKKDSRRRLKKRA